MVCMSRIHQDLWYLERGMGRDETREQSSYHATYGCVGHGRALGLNLKYWQVIFGSAFRKIDLTAMCRLLVGAGRLRSRLVGSCPVDQSWVRSGPCEEIGLVTYWLR